MFANSASKALAVSPFDLVCVALDLETTGLDSNRDTIIEIGAVKFRGDDVLDTLQTFVNPGRPIPDHIQRLTNISPRQVQRAPIFSTIADRVAEFVASHPVIGHNVQFDLKFLESHGVSLGNAAYDTWDLASMLLPRTMRYSLAYLSEYFAIDHSDPHRALSDAKATQGIFLALLRRAAELDPGLREYMARLAGRSNWALASVFEGLEADSRDATSKLGLTGLDLESLASRLNSPEKHRAGRDTATHDPEQIIDLLGPEGPFATAFPGFESRPEQEEMLQAVTRAIYEGRHLVVEGGTGVGKSMAYLLPAVMFAAHKGPRVVISTNTINLQEQLLKKDIPNMLEVLEGAEVIEPGAIQAALLKGKSNYLCLRRWNYLASSESPTVDDARLIGKTAVWLQDTVSGDRGEINLSGRDASTWHRVSAGETGFCPGQRDGSPCFIRAARERAEQAQILVVNHALLMADMVSGGNVIPDYSHLIIDEAHNLEDEATSHLGFQVSNDRVEEVLDTQGRLTTRVRMALRAEELASPVRQLGERAVADVETALPRVRDLWGRALAAAERLLHSQSKGQANEPSQLLLTRELRGQSVWEEMGLAGENLQVGLQQAVNFAARLAQFLDTTALPPDADQTTLESEASSGADRFQGLKDDLGVILGTGDDDGILWVSRNPARGELSFHSAPLDVGAALREQLFARKDSVVLTSATLSTGQNFEYFRGRTGVPEESDELLVGSPFDYQRAALLMIPEDMPPPNDQGYIAALSQVLINLARSAEGRTMALFTSYSSLRAVSNRVRAPLAENGIQVMAQGVDGSAQQLMGRFGSSPNSLLLGTSSFWEGVDWPSGTLKALVLTRLPFQVPTDPIVKARSDQYGNAFRDYSVPQAVLRFRQGIGRLIRNKEDKGVIVVLDRRITSRNYGKSFMDSIPPCTLSPSSISTVGTLAADWIEGRRGTNR